MAARKRNGEKASLVRRAHTLRPDLPAPVIAKALGLSAEYVRAVAKRGGLKLPDGRKRR